MKISACVIAKNEAENLPRWLKSAQGFADEMIVVDTGSSDETAAIAAKAGAKVYSFQWMDDFSAAKNFALDQATGDWVVFTDADEYFTEESVPRVRPLIEEYDGQQDLAGFIVQLVNIDMDTGVLLGTQAKVQRIFRRVPWIRFVGNIHEHVENLSGDPRREMMLAPGLTLYHTGYSPRIMQSKAKRNLTLILARREKGEEHPTDIYHLMDCYYSLTDYPKAAQYAREILEQKQQPFGVEERPYGVLLQSLIVMKAPEQEIQEVYMAAKKAYPTKAQFPLVYGAYTWDLGYLNTAREAYLEGICLHEEHYCEGDFSILLMPIAYTCLGYLSLLSGQPSEAMEYFIRSLRLNPHHVPTFAALCRLFERVGVGTADFIEVLNQIYDQDKDAEFLMGTLFRSPYPHACLYYENRSSKKLSYFQRLLLAGNINLAADHLVQEMERTAAAAVIYGDSFMPEIRESLALLLPHAWHSQEKTLCTVRLQRRLRNLSAL